MQPQMQAKDALASIEQMMQRSSRYTSISGWSAVAAGACALAGALTGWLLLRQHNAYWAMDYRLYEGQDVPVGFRTELGYHLFLAALATLVAAFLSASFFTWRRSQRLNQPFWGHTANKLMWSMVIPMAAGGLFLIKLYLLGITGLMGPGCLLFYGLALVSASQHSYPQMKYLGMAEIALALVSMQFLGLSIAFWAVGFGVLHVLFGLWMVWRFEKDLTPGPSPRERGDTLAT